MASACMDHASRTRQWHEEFIRPLGLSQNQLARELEVPPRRINGIVLGKRGISADTVLRVARHFGMPAEYWLGLQADHELDLARDQSEGQIAREVRVRLEVHDHAANVWGCDSILFVLLQIMGVARKVRARRLPRSTICRREYSVEGRFCLPDT